MKVIGIVGGIGAGKTTVVELMQGMYKTFVISADQIGHKILLKGEKAYEPIIKHFGTKILDENQEIIRRELGKLVFKNKEELLALNKISHPIIYQEVSELIAKSKKEGVYDIIVIDAALLVEIGLVKLVDKVIGVYADEDTRVKRIMSREGFSLEEAMSRIKAQKKWEELQLICNIVIDNTVSLEDTKRQLEMNMNK